jgi:N-acetylmuramoyl-L-alanine amidase
MSPVVPRHTRPVVAVSIAHVGVGGARSADGRVVEEAFSSVCAAAIVRDLAADCDPRLIRSSLEEKARKVNAVDPSCVVEVHLNASLSADHGRGHLTLFAPGSQHGQLLAAHISRALSSALPGRRDLGPQRGEPPWTARSRLTLLADTRCPAVIVEALHVSNPDEVAWLALPEAPGVIARAVAAGVRSWLRLEGRLP